ncbi:MAG: hypothetical protein ABIQ12_07080 [Opitutaceae bacterium]
MFLAFEVWQLVVSERYLGLKQIARQANPRALGLAESTAFFWSVVLFAYWFWMLLLLAVPSARLVGAGLLFVSMIGFSLRRGVRLKWVLVVLTFEGALRVALLSVLGTSAWRALP